MTERKFSKRSIRKTFLRCFFAVILPLMGVFGILNTTPVFADEQTTTSEQTTTEQKTTKNTTENTAEKKETTEAEKKENEENCYSSLGELGWLICPGTGKIANAVDWLYNKIESILQINPIQMKDGEPIYEIWKYCRGITNIIFVIFMLVVIYSQLTGVGISNYGLKKALPKLIIAAILVNLSFLICLVLVDISNIIGMGLRGIFTTVEQTALSSMNMGTSMSMKMSQVYQSLAGGTALALGAGMIAFETGAIWMLIPVVLGAIVAVATGLITIALRQAVVMLLIMVSPLAMVAYILPNTEQLFEKWKKLLIRMLVFYPMFSLLFGASSLAGFAIITGAKDGFGVLLGIAVQIFPLFFSWSLMKMSGTLLGTINEKMRSIAAKPLAANQAWANSRKELSRQKHLASNNVYTPSRYLTQYLSNRKIAREAETAELAGAVKERGIAYGVSRKYVKSGSKAVLSKEGLEAYELQARRMKYAQIIASDKNNFNQGFDPKSIETSSERKREEYAGEINRLNDANVLAADMLFVEQARAEKIDHDNAKSRYERFEDAMNVHQDELHHAPGYKRHKMLTDFDTREKARDRYKSIASIMGGNLEDINYAGAAASASYSTQIKVVSEKYRKYFEMLPPTKDVEYRLAELTGDPDSSKYIDAITSGLRVLNQRGDTDLVTDQMDALMAGGKLRLGTHASQTLASFLMFEVKDNDPTLRRFGKYINLETARIYNKNERQRMSVDFEEYVKGGYTDENGEFQASKKGMEQLLNGTSFDNVERTAFENYDNIIRKAYGIEKNENTGKMDVENNEQFKEYLERKEVIDKAIGPAFISASTKYLSGSEQLTNAVGFKTGITSDGEDEYGIPKTKCAWDKYEDEENRENLQKFYAKETEEYLAKQTPNQLLALRTDYEGSLGEQLCYCAMGDTDFIADDPENIGLVDAYTAAQDDYNNTRKATVAAKNALNNIPDDEAHMQMKADAQARFNDLKGELKNKYATFKDARSELAGQRFRYVVGDETLRQIHQSKQSGAALNAKTWVRKWTMLDGNVAEFEQKLEKRMTAAGRAQSLDNSDNNTSVEDYKNRLFEYMKNNSLSFEHSGKEEYRQGLMDFAKTVIRNDEFEKKFENLCTDLPEAKNDTMYGEFTRLLTEVLAGK